jgi:isoquinoline 1-oxidoreductase alpha subunit
VIIESRSSPDQSRQIKHFTIGRTFGEGQAVPVAVLLSDGTPLAFQDARMDSPGTVTWGGTVMARLTINGQSIDVNVSPNTPLLWAIREQIGLTGTKYGCGIAQCGSCTVHVDGAAVRSCVVPFSAAVGKQVTTIEGLANGGVLHKVQKAWLDHEVPQCGYCQTGMIMAVAALLKAKPKPTDADIDAGITNICRCGTFQQVREAIHAAAKA